MVARLDARIAWTRTGEIIDKLGIDTWSYDESIYWADNGSLQVSVPLLGQAPGARANLDTCRSLRNAMARQTVILLLDGRPMFAGPVVSLKANARRVTVGCCSPVKLFDQRVLLAAGYETRPTDPAANLLLEVAGRDLILELLELALTGAGRDLPITLPAQTGMAGPAVEYLGADLGSAAERIKAVTDTDTGPDVMLRPRVDADLTQLTWAVEVGSPHLGTIAPDVLAPTWDYPSGVDELDVDYDDSEGATTSYRPGDGTRDTRLIGVARATLTDPHAIARERATRTVSSSTRQAELDDLAAADLVASSTPAEKWTLAVHPQQAPLLGRDWQLGDRIRVRVDSSHGWHDAGTYDRRAVGVRHSSRKLLIDTTEVPIVGGVR